jgi:hypothetical protein
MLLKTTLAGFSKNNFKISKLFFQTGNNISTFPISVQRLGYGLDDRGSIHGRDNDGISLHHHVQIGSGTHPASYTMCTGCSYSL